MASAIFTWTLLVGATIWWALWSYNQPDGLGGTATIALATIFFAVYTAGIAWATWVNRDA